MELICIIPKTDERSALNNGFTVHIQVSSSGLSVVLSNQCMTAHENKTVSNVKEKKHNMQAMSMPAIPWTPASVLTKTQSFRGALFLQRGQARICSRRIPPIPLQSLGASSKNCPVSSQGRA